MIKRHKRTPIMHRAVEHNGILYCGGMLADDLKGSMRDQTSEICGKLDKLLAELGSNKSKLLSATIYITDMGRKEQMNAAWLAWIEAEYLPARTTVGVSDLGQGVQVEIMVTAAK